MVDKPTEQEIDAVLSWFKHKDTEATRRKYLEPIMKKHGEKWTDALIAATLNQIIGKHKIERG